jgi:hypothetical protein
VPLPPDLSTVQVTGMFLDATGRPLKGFVTFRPSAVLTDATGDVVVDGCRTYRLEDGAFATGPLAATDSAGISPPGWQYVITIALEDADPLTYTRAIGQSLTPVDVSSLIAQGS